MSTQKRFFDDVAKATGNAITALSGFKAECELLVKQQFDGLMESMKFVRRDEFEAVNAMLAKSRKEQLHLLKRIEVLEAYLGSPPQTAETTAIAAKPKKTAAKQA